MKNFEKELENKLINEEITLPESLSAENIEKLINEKGGIIEPKRIVSFPRKRTAQWVSAAAIFVILIGVTALIGLDMLPVQKENQNINDAEQQQIIEEHVAEPSDYSEIHKTVLSYYKDIYNRTYYTYSDSDSVWNGLFDNFGVKGEADMDMAVGNNNSSDGNSAAVPNAAPESAGTASDDAEHSTTNTQVQGVDEADIVKTDGKYIYYITNNIIRIVECDADAKMKLVSQIKVSEYIDYGFYPLEMYLYDDMLVVIILKDTEYESVTYEVNGELCDCMYYASKRDTFVRCYDLSDIENPKEIFNHNINGEHVSSRVTDGKLITVARYGIPYYSVKTDDFDVACEVVKDLCIPEYSYANSPMQRIPSDRIKVFDEENPSTFIVTSIVNLDDLTAEPKVNAFLGGAEEIYCTKEEVFVAENLYTTWTNDGEYVVKDSLGNKNEMGTKIHKMEITDNGVDYIASVTVCGSFINQFSMDKHGDYFRIATNGMNWNNKKRETMVYVVDKDMKIVGTLFGIAPEEQMKSARFMGNALYLVTFMQTDPLFVVDLADPEKPEIRGELKIPGFSTYLHPAGDGLLIGVGEGGSMTGTDGTAKISLFDVSDPYNPKELDNYSTGTYAQFSGNHKQFVTVDDNTFAVALSFNHTSGKLIVFSITDGGIIIDNIYDAKTGTHRTRGVFISDNVFVVGDSGIYSYKAGNETLVDEIGF